jgi:hypothetical protein
LCIRARLGLSETRIVRVYSYRSARTGSVAMARRAGTATATTATASTIPDAARKLAVSFDFTP